MLRYFQKLYVDSHSASAEVRYIDPAVGALSGIVCWTETGKFIVNLLILYIKISAFFIIMPCTVRILCLSKKGLVLVGVSPSLKKYLTYPGIIDRIPFFCAR